MTRRSSRWPPPAWYSPAAASACRTAGPSGRPPPPARTATTARPASARPARQGRLAGGGPAGLPRRHAGHPGDHDLGRPPVPHQQASTAWQPAGMVVYGRVVTPRGHEPARRTLIDAYRTDARGAWLGPVPGGDPTVKFPMALEDGEWRIAQPPPYLMVTRSWFAQRFHQASLYFFDPSPRCWSRSRSSCRAASSSPPPWSTACSRGPPPSCRTGRTTCRGTCARSRCRSPRAGWLRST